MYFDTQNGCWVRSGKAVGRSFLSRHKEHTSKAHLKDAEDLSSKFYRTYPHSAAKNIDNMSRRGYFEKHLRLYCGLGFDRTRDGNQNMFTDGSEISLFAWPSNFLKQIKAINFRGVPAENIEE